MVVDTDVGSDDLLAIAFLLGRSDVQIDAVIVGTGLTRLTQGARNVLRLLDLMEARDVPVFIGTSRPLQPTVPFPAPWIERSEELGASAAPATSRKPEAEDGTDYLARVLTAGGVAPEILALGPLTNIAVALRKADRDRIRPIRTVIMGGAVDVPGNLVSPAMRTDNTKAEWNIFSDPLAAREVFASPLRAELIGLDATRYVRIDTGFVRALTSGRATRARQYVGKLLAAKRESIERGDYYAWDLLAAAVLVEAGVVQLSPMTLTVDVEPPFHGWTRRSPDAPRVLVATSADPRRFMRAFDAALAVERPRAR